jgi:hypothetical protein
MATAARERRTHRTVAEGSWNVISHITDPETGEELVERRLKCERDSDGLVQWAKASDKRNYRQEAALAIFLAELELHPTIRCWDARRGVAVMRRMTFKSISEAWMKGRVDKKEVVGSVVDKLTSVARLGLCLQDMKDENVVVSEEGEAFFIDVDSHAIIYLDRIGGSRRRCTTCDDAARLVTFFFNFMLLQLLESCSDLPGFAELCSKHLMRDSGFEDVLESFERCDGEFRGKWNVLIGDSREIETSWKHYGRRGLSSGLLDTKSVLPFFFSKTHKLSLKHTSKKARDLAERLLELFTKTASVREPCVDLFDRVAQSQTRSGRASPKLTAKSRRRHRSNSSNLRRRGAN